MTIWEILNIEKTTDKSAIRKAYAKQSKVYHPEREPEKFQSLYKAYQEALDYAKWNEDEEDDFWGEESENVIEEKFAEESAKKLVETAQDISVNVMMNDEEETQYVNINLLSTISADVKKGMEAFEEYFKASEEKDWKRFMVKPEFLRVQFHEQFIMLLVKFLKEQSTYAIEELPFEMVREMLFSYFPYSVEQVESPFGDAFTEFYDLLCKNKKINLAIDQHNNPKYLSEVVKYNIYYQLRKNVLEIGNTSNIEIWTMYMGEINRGLYITDGIKSTSDYLIYELVAFIISEAGDFTDEIYKYMINSFRFADEKNSSRWKYLQCVYKALEKKGVKLEVLNTPQSDGAEEIRAIMKEVDKLCKQNLTEEDRTKVGNFFNGELFGKYKLDSVFLIEKLYVYLLQKNLISDIFIEEYLAFYDEVYAKTNSLVGREIYTLLSSRKQDGSKPGEDCEELGNEGKEWVLTNFFEEGFTRVWNSTKPGAMKVIYRSILTSHMEAFANQENYEWDLWDEGHLYVIKDGSNYDFIKESIEIDENNEKVNKNEKVTLTIKEYYQILEEMLEKFTGRFTCLPSEKKKWEELMIKAGNLVQQN